MLEVKLLGQFEVRLDGQPLEIPSRPAQSLLAFLILNSGTPYRREKVAGLLWPDSSENNARNNLRQALWRIRKSIEDGYLQADRLSVSFTAEKDFWLDAHVLETAASSDIPVDVLEEAVSVYEGELLPGFYDPWVSLERERLQRVFEQQIQRLLQLLIKDGRWDDANQWAERWISFGQTPEPAYRALMTSAAGRGDQASVAAAFHRCVQALEEEVGVEPSPETTALYEKILAGDIVLNAQPTGGIEGYELKEEIGAGAYGSIHRAYQLSVGREVAVKKILPKYANDPEFIGRFEVEAQNIAHLEHPNIVPLYDFWRGPDGAYLVMRLLRGGSLLSSLSDGPWQVEPALGMMDQIASALAAAHRQGIVHRDVKASNILLDEEGNAYLSDFGIAKDLTDAGLTAAGAVVGTPEYISPEQIRGEEVSPQSDIYSLGIVLYETLTGEKPFVGSSLANLIHKQLEEPLPPVTKSRPELPAGVERIIQRATAKRPAERYPDAPAMAEALRGALGGVEDEVDWVQKGKPAKNSQVRLPLQATPFVGRAEELASLSRLLADPNIRLLTILGPGGMGKTRLAIEAARGQAESFADGVYFISLASVDEPGFIASQIADTLEFHFHLRHKREDWEDDTQVEQLLAYLKGKQLLLLLDNCEQLLTSALPHLPASEKSLDQLAADIVQTAPQVKILATSRERLNLHGETAMPLDGLALPALANVELPDVPDPAASDAVQLFRHGARRVRPDFELGPSNLADVVDICRLAGGMPLAIELSDAWVELLTPKEIVAEIRNNLDFLETDLGNIPDRQRSMRLVFESTWGRLAPIEQEVFQQLSVFRGGFTREAAQTVTGASLRTQMALVNKSLLRSDSGGRYQLHELLRQFAAERLAQDPSVGAAVKDRHCSYYSTFLLEIEPELGGPDQGKALTEIEKEFDNVRAAWRWAVAQEKFEEIEKAMESVCEYLRIRGRLNEPGRFFQPAAKALGWKGFGRPEDIPDSDGLFDEIVQELNASQKGDKNGDERQLLLGKVMARDNRHWCESPSSHWAACQVLRQSLRLLSQFGERLEIAWLLRYGAHVWLTPWQSIALYKQALAIFEEFDDERGIIGSRMQQGSMAIRMGDWGEAERLVRDTLARAQKLESREIVMDCQAQLGRIHWALGKYEQAQEFCRQSIMISRKIGYPSQIAFNQRILAYVALSQGDPPAAKRYLHDSQAIYEEIGLRGLTAEVLAQLSHIAVSQGDYPAAMQLAEQSLQICQEQEHRTGMIEPNTVLGEAALGLGELESAEQYFERAIKIAGDRWRPPFTLHALVGLARLLAVQGDVEGAYRLGTFVVNNPASWHWSKDSVATLLSQLEAEMPPESVLAAREWANEKELEEVTSYYLSSSTSGDPRLSFA
jgi:predicted ATPase/DNA-binding SARP family transcriptional activator/tRNA A-37 threonylcarbamoyl transferase component Bud32